MRQDGHRREPLVSEQQNLFHVWAQGSENALKCAGMDMPAVSDAS